jgi:hypothetical protein
LELRPTNGTTLLDPVAELGHQRGKDAERADDRHRDDDHRPDADRLELLVAREEHPRDGDHHRRARDEHGLA